MNFSDTIARQAVDQLIQDLEDGVISAEDHTKLMELMRQHASVRELYLQHIRVGMPCCMKPQKANPQLETLPINEEMLATEPNAKTRLSPSHTPLPPVAAHWLGFDADL